MDLEITPAWLQGVLARDFPGIEIRSVETEPIGEGYGLASERRRCRFASGPGSVIVKRWSTEGPGGAGEVHFYREVGTIPGLRTPHCHHAEIDTGAREGVLVLEDMGEVIQGDCLETVSASRAEAVARGLAALHAAYWNDPRLTGMAWLPPGWPGGRDRDWIEERRSRFLNRHGHLVETAGERWLRDLESLLVEANHRLAGAPETLLHGDFHLDNVLFRRGTDEVVILDWARVARGPAVSDAVVLVTAVAESGDRERVLDVYRRELEARGVTIPESPFRRHFGAALIRQFCRASCGVANWEVSPGRETALLETGFRQAVAVLDWWGQTVEPELLG